MSSRNVVVTLELGHRATVRQQRGNEVFTHDWEVFVHGTNGSRIDAFIEKIVFTLHKSFSKPKRVVKNPPYKVSEKGYGSFNLPIEIYFKTNNTEDTRKAQFEYDLFLQHVECPPINHKRNEKLTFLKPSDDFRKKLLLGGGIIVTGQEDSSQGDKTAVSRPSSGAKIKPHAAVQHQPEMAKKHKHQIVREPKAKPESKVSDQFSALFGEPIKKVTDQRKTSKEKPPKEKEKVPDKVTEKYKDKTPASKSSEKKPKDKHKSEKSSSSSTTSVPPPPPSTSSEVKEEKRDKVKEKSHKDKHKRDRDKDRDKHKKDKDRDKDSKKQREKETTKRASSPSSKRLLSPASKRSSSPVSKRSLSPASKRSLSPASSIKSDSSAKRKKCEPESTKIVEKPVEEIKEKKKDKKKDKKEKRRDKEETPIVEPEREKPVDKVVVKTESITKMAAPVLKEVVPVKSGDRSPTKERAKVEHKAKKIVHKETIKEEPIVVTPQVVVKEKKVKEKPVPVPPPAPIRSRSSSKSTSQSRSPTVSVSRSPSPPCSRSSSKSSRSRSPPSPASVGRESPCPSRSASRSRSPVRSKSRSHSRSSSGSRRSVSRSPSVSRSKSRSPSRSPSHSRSLSRSRSKSRSRSVSVSGSRSPSSSPARSKSRSASRSPTASPSSSSSGSSPSRMSVANIQSQVPITRAGPPRPPLAAGADSRATNHPLSIMMKEVSSSSSESEERVGDECKGPVKVPLRSPPDTSRSSHAASGQQVSTTPRQIVKEPILSSDDEAPPIKDNSRVGVKREPITRRPPQREKKKRRSQQDTIPATTSLPAASPKETVKPIKEEIKQEDIKGVKEEPSAASRLTPEYLKELVELQHKIMNSVDRHQLQQVVDIIAEHSSFQLTHAHFNFDLCSLDAQVVKQLQGCFS